MCTTVIANDVHHAVVSMILQNAGVLLPLTLKLDPVIQAPGEHLFMRMFAIPSPACFSQNIGVLPPWILTAGRVAQESRADVRRNPPWYPQHDACRTRPPCCPRNLTLLPSRTILARNNRRKCSPYPPGYAAGRKPPGSAR